MIRAGTKAGRESIWDELTKAMHPEIPWNVAGIPPEARDIARTAARREGLSVGEWLSRRILRSFDMDGEDRDSEGSNGEEWYPKAVAREVLEPGGNKSLTGTTSIERQLEALASRLETAEWSQAENSRAMSSAAAEITVAAREQAEAFDRLAAHVTEFDQRLAEAEREAQDTRIEEAVKELREELSNVKEDVRVRGRESASQLAALAQKIESLAERVETSEQSSADIAQEENGRLATLDERVVIVEQVARATASALGRFREGIERLRASHAAQAREFEQGFANIAWLTERVGSIDDRIGAAERNGSAVLARLDTLAAEIGAKASAGQFKRRFQSIESALSSIATRMEGTERGQHQDAYLRGILRELAAHLETADKHHRKSIAELRAASAETARKTAELEKRLNEATCQRHVISDVPPFVRPPGPVQGGAQFSSSATRADNSSGEMPGSGAFAAALAPHLSNTDYLAAGRHSARVMALEQERIARDRPNAFVRGPASPAASPDRPKRRETRRSAVAAILLAGALASLAGTLLSRGLGLPLPNTNSAARQTTAAPKGRQAMAAVVPAATRPTHFAAPPKSQAGQPAMPGASASLENAIRLAGSGDSKAELALGLKYLDGNGIAVNEAEAARWLTRAAQQGEAVAQYRLATMYQRGRGVPADAAQAAHWYELAAKQGNRKAMHDLAVAYADGSGEPKNDAQAVLWFGRAAALGLADSQFNLAVLYERGMGVKQSLVDAYKWYAIAAAEGDGEAKARLDAIGAQLSPADRAAAKEAAAAFKTEPVDPASNSAVSSSG